MTWSMKTPVPRTFECRLCGATVIVDDRRDRRTVFCCSRCEREYWRHRERYDRTKNIARGHVVFASQLNKEIE